MFVITRPKTSRSVNHVLLLPVHIDRNKIMVVSVNIVNVMQQGGPGEGSTVTFQKCFFKIQHPDLMNRTKDSRAVKNWQWRSHWDQGLTWPGDVRHKKKKKRKKKKECFFLAHLTQYFCDYIMSVKCFIFMVVYGSVWRSFSVCETLKTDLPNTLLWLLNMSYEIHSCQLTTVWE